MVAGLVRAGCITGGINDFLSSEVAGMLATEKELVRIIAQEMEAGIDEALSGWMVDIEDVLDSGLSDSAKLSAIQSIVNVCKRDLSAAR
jgi:hypothetical protein